MTNSKYAPKQWQSDRFDIECPSGQLCLARKLQMEDIVKLGIIDELDMFTEFAAQMGEVSGKADQMDESAIDLIKDTQRFERMVTIVDKVVCEVVLEPQIVRPIKKDKKGKETPLAPSEYKEGVIYSSFLDFNDKMHIFGAAFSGETIEQFRGGPEETA